MYVIAFESFEVEHSGNILQAFDHGDSIMADSFYSFWNVKNLLEKNAKIITTAGIIKRILYLSRLHEIIQATKKREKEKEI